MIPLAYTQTFYRSVAPVMLTCIIATSIMPEAHAALTEASLDFGRPLQYIDFLDGAGIGQFEEERNFPDDPGVGITSWYCDLTGFPDDESDGGFKTYMDVAYTASAFDGAKGMALHGLWFMPGGNLGEGGWVADTWQSIDWDKLNFEIFEPAHSTDPATDEYQNQTIVFVPYHGYAKAHLTAVVNAAAKRARAENLRMMFFYDSKGTPDHVADNATRGAFYYAVVAKYFISRYGIPVQVCGMQNEDGPRPSVELLRSVLDAGKLYGLKILPGSPTSSGSMNRHIEIYPEGSAHWNATDYIGTHSWGTDKSDHSQYFLRSTNDWARHRKWATSWRPWKGANAVYYGAGSFAQTFTDGTFSTEEQRATMDNYALCLAYHVENGGSGAQVWQLGNRTGHFEDRGYIDNACPNKFCTSASVSKDGPTQEYDPYIHGIPGSVDAAATVNPFVRPGMWYVQGSHPARWPSDYNFSVVGFTGKGRKDVAVIYNDQQPRDFALTLSNLEAEWFDVYQAKPDDQGRRYLGRVPREGDLVTVSSVPADSITTLVAADAIATKARVILVIKDSSQPTEQDIRLRHALEGMSGAEVIVVDQTPTAAQLNFFNEMRMPFDPMGTACYVISTSVDDERVAYAHRSAMAPVLVLDQGEHLNRTRIGLNANHRVAAGEFLDLRDPGFDLPARFLDNGLPRSCGFRSALEASTGADSIQREVQWLVAAGGATDVVPTPADTSSVPAVYETPELDGTWWQIAPDEPDVSPYTYCRKLTSSAVDFTLFQAADGTWRLISCIRNICELTGNRLLHEWKSSDLNATLWEPVGILGHSGTIGACAVDPGCTNSVRAPHGFKYQNQYYLFFDSGGARCLVSPDGINWERHVNHLGNYRFFEMTRDLNVTYTMGRWQAVFLANPNPVHPSGPYMAGRTAPTPEGPWSDPAVVVRSEGNPESPFILERNGIYYLWQQDEVFVSTDPLDFTDREPITSMWRWKYAPEVFEHEGQWYVAAYDRGIWLAKMRWTGGQTQPLTISTASLPPATVGTPYSASLSASGGNPPYTWDLESGRLPGGLLLDSSTGGISGTPLANGTLVFTVRVTDTSAAVATQVVSLTVEEVPAVPSPPTSLAVVATSTAAIDLHWQDNSDNEDGFVLERSTNGVDGWVTVASVNADSTSFRDSGLQPETVHFYRVSAFNEAGTSASSATVAGRTRAAPPPGSALVHASFAYESGSLHDRDGGHGFSAPWAAREGLFTVTVPGLDFTGMSTIGGASTDASGNPAWANRPFPADGLTSSGSVLWWSMLVRIDSQSSDLRVKWFANETSYSTGSGLRVLSSGPVKIEINGTERGTEGTISTGETHLIVGRFEFVEGGSIATGAGNDLVHVWIDPPIATAPTLESAAAFSTAEEIQTQGAHLSIRGGGSFQGTVDEIRLGHAFADVVPPPVFGDFGSYEAWRDHYLWHVTDPDALLPTAVVSGFGLSNAAAFALGLDPLATALNGSLPHFEPTGPGWRLTFRRAEPPSVRYILQESTNLSTWSPAKIWEPEEVSPASVEWVPAAEPTEATFYRLQFELALP